MKAADIMAAATPGPWSIGPKLGPDEFWYGGGYYDVGTDEGGGFPMTESQLPDARAIVTAVNLFPLYEAVREAAQFTATRAGDPVEFTHLSPTGPDLLDAIAAYMDRMDDHAERDPYRDGPVSREVQADVRRWAASLRAALDALQAAEDAL